MKRLVCVGVLLALGSSVGRARAAASDNDWDGGYKQTATRRSGFVFGVTAGLAVGRAHGYPNELARIDDPRYDRNTALGVGSANRLWLGGALTDWFVFGVGLVGLSVEHHDVHASGGGFVFHVEGYPLFQRGGIFRDLSLFGDFGAGSMNITGRNRPQADGGLMSVVGFGAGWEAVRFWKLRFGPAVEYFHLWSQPLTSDTVSLEARLTFVGGP